MNNSIKYMVQSWQSLANTYPDMRYPAYNLSVRCGYDGNTKTNKVSIYLETFIQNEGGTRICLTADNFEYYGQYKPHMLEQAIERFTNKCKLTKEKYIFTVRTSIREPFDFNK